MRFNTFTCRPWAMGSVRLSWYCTLALGANSNLNFCEDTQHSHEGLREGSGVIGDPHGEGQGVIHTCRIMDISVFASKYAMSCPKQVRFPALNAMNLNWLGLGSSMNRCGVNFSGFGPEGSSSNSSNSSSSSWRGSSPHH